MSTDFNKVEEEILAFWQKNKIFEKTLSKESPKGDYVFYDGPPFATGMPHYGHILGSVIKDLVPRYKTMKGYHVRRRWGWDCHGLPIENLVEKELGLSGKKEIEEKVGIKKFNQTCRSKVLTYTKDWRKMIDRIGRWIEFDNAYKTMDQSYMESVWWAIKTIWNKGLIYEGRKVLMYCPHCETPISKAEVAMDESYKDITEEAVIVKFRIKDTEKHKLPENTYILAWTTTPWTLPGNVALAVGKGIDYSLIKISGEEGHCILATDRLAVALQNKKYKVIKSLSGKSLVGLEYEPLFDVQAVRDTGKKAWYVTAADFVTTTEGTGVVHTAVIYGEDDYNLGVKIDLPMVPLLDQKGVFNSDAPELIRGVYFKKSEKAIKEDLEKRGLLFSKENNTHSYPHCWRCDTQLFYNAISAWFIDIQKIKKRLIQLNEKINWYPEHLKHGRFLNILETAPDWNISRNRYWATPLPFWRCENDKCKEVKCLGSIDELRQAGDRQITKLIFVRHGESEKNVLDISSRAVDKFPLTQEGAEDVKKLGQRLKSREKIDLIIASPTLRTRQSAELLRKELGAEFKFDEGINENNGGEWDDKLPSEVQKMPSYIKYEKLATLEEKFYAHPGINGETREEIITRTKDFIRRVNQEYAGKNILVVGHGCTYAALHRVLEGTSYEQYFIDEKIGYHQERYFYLDQDGASLDLHKDNVDEIKLTCLKCGQAMQRIPEVIDCWVESASMPFAEFHYPFENNEIFKKRFPGQYIAEYIAQTRAWFYYMHVMSTLLFDNISFENCVTTGTILNEKGEKLSKSKMNYTDPWVTIKQYGADTLRYYLMTSVVMQADNLSFNDREVRDIYNKVINTLWNVFEFYKIYAGDIKSKPVNLKPVDILDKWILAKLQILVREVTEKMDQYDTVNAGRPIGGFINELSTWWLRRSRERFKSGDGDGREKQEALNTLYLILNTLSKLLAPFTPFLSEQIYQEVIPPLRLRGGEEELCAVHNAPQPPLNLRGGDEAQSVHLAQWPSFDKKLIDEDLIERMGILRQIISLGLEQRAKASMPVRQVLSSVTISTNNYKKIGLSVGSKGGSTMIINRESQPQWINDLIKAELNVKKVYWKISKEKEFSVELDLVITDELKKEGLGRELIRQINSLRKEAKLTIHDQVDVILVLPSDLMRRVVEEQKEQIQKAVLAKSIFLQVNKLETKWHNEVKIDNEPVWIGLKR